MPILNASGSPVYKNSIRGLETTDPVHPSVNNPVWQDLLDNDAYLKNRIDGVDTLNLGPRVTALEGLNAGPRLNSLEAWKAAIDPNGNGIEWGEVANKPTAFPPAAHTHPELDPATTRQYTLRVSPFFDDGSPRGATPAGEKAFFSVVGVQIPVGKKLVLDRYSIVGSMADATFRIEHYNGVSYDVLYERALPVSPAAGEDVAANADLLPSNAGNFRIILPWIKNNSAGPRDFRGITLWMVLKLVDV